MIEWRELNYRVWCMFKLMGDNFPISFSALLEAGGKVVGHVGISSRPLVVMPDDTLFAGGLDHDGAMYLMEGSRMPKFGQNTVARNECKTVKVLPRFQVAVNGVTIVDEPLDLMSLPEYSVLVESGKLFIKYNGKDLNLPIRSPDKISIYVGC